MAQLRATPATVFIIFAIWDLFGLFSLQLVSNRHILKKIPGRQSQSASLHISADPHCLDDMAFQAPKNQVHDLIMNESYKV